MTGRGEFAPSGAITGIGSLPFDAVGVAMEAVRDLSPELPFWPQLPQRSRKEGIIAQGLGMLSDFIVPRQEGYGYEVKPGKVDAVAEALHRGDGSLAVESAAGFHVFVDALAKGEFAGARAVKGQIEGPITLAAFLFHRGKPFLEEPTLFAAVAFHVSQMVCWQVERLARAGKPVLLFVDEPALCLQASRADEERWLSALAAALRDAKSRGAWAGLHCCAASPFARMAQVKADILSFDAHEGLERFFLDPAARAFAGEGGIVAYGLIPTQQSLDGIGAASIFRRWFALASSAGDPREMARRAIVTATCGLGMLDASAARESFALAAAVGAKIRSLAA